MSFRRRLDNLWKQMEGMSTDRLPGCDCCRGRSCVLVPDIGDRKIDSEPFDRSGRCRHCGIEACSILQIVIPGMQPSAP